MTTVSVHVREYRRIRKGRVERVREHPRKPRRWFRRPTPHMRCCD